MFFIKKRNESIDIEYIREELEIFETDIIYIGGSLIEGEINPNSLGMGNILSDIDFFIIREHENFMKTKCIYDDNYKKTLFIKKLKSDIEIFDKSFIKLLINQINDIKYDTKTRIANIIKLDISLSDINEFLCRLYNSICLYNNKDYIKLKKVINNYKFLELYSIDCLNLIENEIDDVVGNLNEKQYDVALHCMRSVFINFSRYFIMKNSEYIDRDKWVFLKLFNIISENYHNDIKVYYDILFCSNIKNNKEKVILDSLNFVRKKLEFFSLEDILV